MLNTGPSLQGAGPLPRAPSGVPQPGLCVATCFQMRLVGRTQLHVGGPSRLPTWREESRCTAAPVDVSLSSARLPRLWFGTHLPSLAQRLFASRRRGPRLSFWSESFRNSGSPPLNVVPGPLPLPAGEPCHRIRAAHTTSSCSDLLRELSSTHRTKPNFPAARKFSVCLAHCASHRLLLHLVVYRYLLPLLGASRLVQLAHYCCIPLLRRYVDSTGNHDNRANAWT